MALYRIGDLAPTIHETAYVAEGATIIGQVILEAGASVWPGAVLRGDNAPIVIGVDSNVQDGAVLHVDPGCPVTLGRGVTIGHQVMLHGCTIHDGCLIGIQSVILNNAVIGEKCLVGAGALVTEGKEFPPRSLIIGAPAKLARELTDEQADGLARNANSYKGAQPKLQNRSGAHRLTGWRARVAGRARQLVLPMGDITGAGDDDETANDGPHVRNFGEHEIAQQAGPHQLDEGDRLGDGDLDQAIGFDQGDVTEGGENRRRG